MSNNTSNPKSSLPPCEICHSKTAIYRCPRCSIRTCSLACCRSHKTSSRERDPSNTKNGGKSGGKSGGKNGEDTTSTTSTTICNGKRDRTKFCMLNQFNDSQLASDYHFLEDVLKVSESSKRLYQGLTDGASSGPSSVAKRSRYNTTSSTTPATSYSADGRVSGKIQLDSIGKELPVHPLLKSREGKGIAEILANGVRDVEEDNGEGGQQSSASEFLKSKVFGNATSSGDGDLDKSPKRPKRPTQPQPSDKKEKMDPLVRMAELKEINLLRMPSGMERHKSNSTKFNKKQGDITWKVELCFHSPIPKTNDNSIVGNDGEVDTKNASSISNSSRPTIMKIETNISDSSTLAEELGKHLDVHPGNATTRSTLKSFTNVPRESLFLFLKRVPCSSAAPKYYLLDPKATLTECLRGKTIIEFPTIDVVLEEDKARFPLFINEVS